MNPQWSPGPLLSNSNMFLLANLLPFVFPRNQIVLQDFMLPTSQVLSSIYCIINKANMQYISNACFYHICSKVCQFLHEMQKCLSDQKKSNSGMWVYIYIYMMTSLSILKYTLMPVGGLWPVWLLPMRGDLPSSAIFSLQTSTEHYVYLHFSVYIFFANYLILYRIWHLMSKF